MDDCVGSSFAFSYNGKKDSRDDEDQEFKALEMAARKINPVSKQCNGPMPLAALLKSGEVCNGERVKIVLTIYQLQLLMRSMEELKLRHYVIRAMQKNCNKWRPSLATIPEL